MTTVRVELTRGSTTGFWNAPGPVIGPKYPDKVDSVNDDEEEEDDDDDDACRGGRRANDVAQGSSGECLGKVGGNRRSRRKDTNPLHICMRSCADQCPPNVHGAIPGDENHERLEQDSTRIDGPKHDGLKLGE